MSRTRACVFPRPGTTHLRACPWSLLGGEVVLIVPPWEVRLWARERQVLGRWVVSAMQGREGAASLPGDALLGLDQGQVWLGDGAGGTFSCPQSSPAQSPSLRAERAMARAGHKGAPEPHPSRVDLGVTVHLSVRP